MSVSPENDRDGVDRPEPDGVHENTRSSAEGVEEAPDTESGHAAAASPGLIGNGAGIDPRDVAQR